MQKILLALVIFALGEATTHVVLTNIRMNNIKASVSALQEQQSIESQVPENPFGDGPIHVYFSSSTIAKCENELLYITSGFGEGRVDRKSICFGGTYISTDEAVQLIIDYLKLKYTPEVPETTVPKIKALFTK